MKKLTTALLTAGLLLSASACASPQLTTAETCDRIKIVVSNPTNSLGKTGMTRLANQIRPIEAVSSDDLKPALQAILDYTDESVKEKPDTEKLNALKADYEQAGSTYSKFCS
ncbi:hypothetical protein ASG92_20965 [Arthrobacter sp. Soil736]|uniref:hypothetical protein n=1 Tax=Arthrobacter sp. Soil736 TaxID=1736395 RepID=UPI0006F7E82C|nr:hypothetical protein [Arthrobacter sp. Soil736]KRE61463.1 hypothetical protein ASG92_20965 [Arthrobacter sp. Soil736]